MPVHLTLSSIYQKGIDVSTVSQIGNRKPAFVKFLIYSKLRSKCYFPSLHFGANLSIYEVLAEKQLEQH